MGGQRERGVGGRAPGEARRRQVARVERDEVPAENRFYVFIYIERTGSVYMYMCMLSAKRRRHSELQHEG